MYIQKTELPSQCQHCTKLGYADKFDLKADEYWCTSLPVYFEGNGVARYKEQNCKSFIESFGKWYIIPKNEL